MRSQLPDRKNVIVVVADSAREDIFSELLQEGRLAHIDEHIVSRGVLKKALSTFPTTTGPAHLPFLTGMHPGTANIPGYRWIDREAICGDAKRERKYRSYNSLSGLRYYRDMDPAIKTLYDYFSKPAIVLEPINLCRSKLVSPTFGKAWRIFLAHYTRFWRPVQRYSEKKLLSFIRRGSDCIVAVFLGIDEYSHLTTPFSEKTIRSYIEIDRAVGRAAHMLKKKGLYEKTLFAIVSDHGHTATHTHIPVVDLMKERGFKPLYFPRVLKKDRDSAVMESGNAMAALYFKMNGSWTYRPTEPELEQTPKVNALLNDLVNHPGISFVSIRTEKGIVIRKNRGKCYASPTPDGLVDIRIEGENPLGGHLREGVFAARQIFSDTFHDIYPDAVNQLLLLQRSPRSGDVVLSAEPGYDLRKQHEHPEHKSSHGSLHKAHMVTPFAANFNFTGEKMSTMDIFPVLLKAAGFEIPDNLDGQCFL